MPRTAFSSLSSLALVALVGTFAFAGCASEPEEEAEDSEGALAVIGEEPTGRASRHPIVLAHGFDASDTNHFSYNGVEQALERDGHVVVTALVAPYQSVEKRAKELTKYVDKAVDECRAKQGCDASRVHLIAHSMGGLDSRYLTAKLTRERDGVPYAKIIASVTTISTPHRGTAIADRILALVPNAADPAVDALATLWAKTFTADDLAEQTDLRAALTGLSEGNAPRFNAEIKDVAGVYYQSWAGITAYVDPYIDDKEVAACDGKVESYNRRADHMSDHGPIFSAQLELAFPIIGHGIGNDADPNDGLITVASSKWGNFRGCIPADHMDEVGQRFFSDGPAPWSRFDHIRFYRRMAFGLDAAVDGQRAAR